MNNKMKKSIFEVAFEAEEDAEKADIDIEKNAEAEIDLADDNDDDPEAMSKEELLQKAKDMGLNVNANMSKEDLIKTIREA